MRLLFALTYYRPYTSGLTIYVERLAKALTRLPTAIEWSEADAPPVSVPDDGDVESIITH